VQLADGGMMVDFEFDELKREFLVEAEEKVREIESKLDGDRRPENLQRLIYLAHQLKGSGGSYGFEGISTHAVGLEKALESPGRLDEKIRQHVVNLRAEIDQRSRELAASVR
jgi:HPt (histidine-containing phosphotransfer) domain-containing protein